MEKWNEALKKEDKKAARFGCESRSSAFSDCRSYFSKFSSRHVSKFTVLKVSINNTGWRQSQSLFKQCVLYSRINLSMYSMVQYIRPISKDLTERNLNSNFLEHIVYISSIHMLTCAISILFGFASFGVRSRGGCPSTGKQVSESFCANGVFRGFLETVEDPNSECLCISYLCLATSWASASYGDRRRSCDKANAAQTIDTKTLLQCPSVSEESCRWNIKIYTISIEFLATK